MALSRVSSMNFSCQAIFCFISSGEDGGPGPRGPKGDRGMDGYDGLNG